MRDLIKFILCVIILVVAWNNFDKLLEIGNIVIEILYDKLMMILGKIK